VRFGSDVQLFATKGAHARKNFLAINLFVCDAFPHRKAFYANGHKSALNDLFNEQKQRASVIFS
jgi:hypothetical protein